MDLDSYRKKSANDQMLIYGAFGNRKNNVYGYKFDLDELINHFSQDGFRGFIQRGRSINGAPEFGGFMVITDKQYILGYNANLGQGTHTSAYANCMSLLKGNDINNDNDVIYLSSECQKNFITVRFVYEKMGRNQYGTWDYEGRILFDFGSLDITPGKLKALENFCNEYSQEFKYITEYYKFKIFYSYLDGVQTINDKIMGQLDEDKNVYANRGSFFQPQCHSLEDVLNFARRRLNTEAKNTSSDDEIIIGVANEQVKSL